MIIKNGKTISSVIKGSQVIGAIYKGAVLIYEAFKNLLVSGIPPLTLTKSKGVDLVDYKLYGDSVQEGTPTPETPIEVESVGERTKNLCNIGTITFTQYKEIKLVEPIPAGTYTLSCNITTNDTDANDNLVGFLNSNGDTIAYLYGLYRDGRTSKVFTLTETAYSILLYASNNWSYGSGDTATYKDIQIEKGSVATKYEGYYKIPVKVSGKNLFDGVLKLGQMSWGEATNYRRVEKTLEAGTYAISFSEKIYKQASNIAFTNPSGNFQTNTFTLTETTDCYIQFRGYDNVNGAGQTEEFFNSLKIQIEKGNTSTEYEPYIEPITANINLNEPLRKIGEYTDYVDFEKGKVIRNFGEVLKNKTGVTLFSSTDTYNQFSCSRTTYFPNSKRNGIVTSSYMTQRNKVTGVLNNVYLGSSYFNLCVDTSYTLEKIQELLDNTPMQVLYELDTPTEETIELPNIPTIKGTTILSVDTTIQPSNIEVVYKGKE